jgi:hypothetical protein
VVLFKIIITRRFAVKNDFDVMTLKRTIVRVARQFQFGHAWCEHTGINRKFAINSIGTSTRNNLLDQIVNKNSLEEEQGNTSEMKSFTYRKGGNGRTRW